MLNGGETGIDGYLYHRTQLLEGLELLNKSLLVSKELGNYNITDLLESIRFLYLSNLDINYAMSDISINWQNDNYKYYFRTFAVYIEAILFIDKTIFGKNLYSILKILFNDDIVKKAQAIHQKLCSLLSENQKELKSVRNNVTVHRDKNIEKQFIIIDSIDKVKYVILGIEVQKWYSSLINFLKPLIKEIDNQLQIMEK